MRNTNKNQQDSHSSYAMGSRSIGKLLLEFSIPAIATMLVTSLYNFVDRILIGQGTGVNGIAAVTAVYPLMIGSLALGMLFSAGARSLSAMSLGSGNKEGADIYITQATCISFCSASLLALVLWLFVEPLLRMFGATDTILADAKAYAGWILLSIPGQTALMSAASSLPAGGRPRAGFMVQLLGTVINAVLAPIFIFVFGWGVAGAGAAIAAAQTIGLFITLGYVFSPKSIIKIRLKFLAPRMKPLMDLIRVGIPLLLFQLLTFSTLAIANIVVKPFRDEIGLAIIGIIITVGQFLGFPLFGIITGAQPLWSYNYSANKWQRVKDITKLTLLWTIGIALVSELAMVGFPSFFIGLFSSNENLLQESSHLLRIFLLGFFLFPIEFGPAMYFQATGRPKPAVIMMLLRSCSFIAGMIIMPKFLGFDGVFWAGPASDALSGIVGSYFCYKMYKEIQLGVHHRITIS